MKEAVFISTDHVDMDQKADLWRDLSRPLFESTPWEDERGGLLEGTVRMRVDGSLVSGITSFNRQQYVRDASVIRQSGLDNYVIQVFMKGALVGDFNGANVAASEGDISVIDLSQPLVSRVEAGGRMTFVIPRHPLEKALGGKNVHGAVLRKEWSITTLLRSYLEGLHAVSPDLSETEADAAQEALVRLMASGLQGKAIESAVDHSALAGALRRRVLDFLDANIQHPDLSPEFIMRRFKVSRSHLYRTFMNEGGIAKVLRDRRLDAAFHELTQSTTSSVLIAEVAHKLGFSSGNQLLRAFRSRFGLTPSEARAEYLKAPRPAGQDHGLLSYYTAIRDRVGET